MLNKLKTCRCCLIETAEESELYEFSSEVSVNPETATKPEFVKIAHCFRESTSIDVPENEEDTSKVCVSCLRDLKFCYLFLKQCWESERTYKNPAEGEMRFCKFRVDLLQFSFYSVFPSEPEYEYEEEHIEDMPDDQESTNEVVEYEETSEIKAEYNSDIERADEFEVEEVEGKLKSLLDLQLRWLIPLFRCTHTPWLREKSEVPGYYSKKQAASSKFELRASCNEKET